jgi:hypothetical protein
MKKIVFLMLLTACAVACNKELSRSEKKEDTPRVNVAVGTIDDSDDPAPAEDDSTASDDNGGNTVNEGDVSDDGNSQEISGTEENEHAVYTFMGVSGLYFGCSSTFKTDKESLEFIFGTSKTTNLAFTQEEFEQLIHVGERQFGSLGAFTTYPQRLSDKVEIAYTDKHGRRWCSTRIKERKTGQGVETTVEIANDGEFYLEEAHKFEIAAETEGYRLKGRFECTLYEVNGNARRHIKGDFTGIVAPK